MANNAHYAIKNIALEDLNDELIKSNEIDKNYIKNQIDNIRSASKFDVIIPKRDMIYVRAQIEHELERYLIEKNNKGIIYTYSGGNIILRLPEEDVYSGIKPGITFSEFENEDELEMAVKNYGLPFDENRIERFLD
jgi:hypothetical protein